MNEVHNILLIVTDDQGAWAMGCAGNPEIRTPHLDRLAATGTRFTNYFCMTPVCSAARAAMLTGANASMNGVHDWLAGGKDIEFLAGQDTVSEALADGGYQTGFVGKWHLGLQRRALHGFSHWRAKQGAYMDGHFVDESGREHFAPGFITERITDEAIAFMDSARTGDRPFFLDVCYNAPHSPWEREHHPAELWDDYYHHCPFESLPYGSMHSWDAGLTDFFFSPEARRRKLSGYCTAITAMDAGVGRIIDWLEEHGLRENTLILFTSDNGMNMGHHGICGKGNGTIPTNLYDTSVKVPCIASQPGAVPQGIVNEGMYSHVDLLPTFLDVAKLPDPGASRRPGQSFAPALRGDAHDGDEIIYIHDEYGHTRMARTREWKYIHRYPDGPHELYDLVHDPDEATNLYDQQVHTDRIKAMKQEMETWFRQYSLPQYDGIQLPVTGCGQTNTAGRPDAFQQDWPDDWKAFASQLRNEAIKNERK